MKQRKTSIAFDEEDARAEETEQFFFVEALHRYEEKRPTKSEVSEIPHLLQILLQVGKLETKIDMDLLKMFEDWKRRSNELSERKDLLIPEEYHKEYSEIKREYDYLVGDVRFDSKMKSQRVREKGAEILVELEFRMGGLVELFTNRTNDGINKYLEELQKQNKIREKIKSFIQ